MTYQIRRITLYSYLRITDGVFSVYSEDHRLEVERKFNSNAGGRYTRNILIDIARL